LGIIFIKTEGQKRVTGTGKTHTDVASSEKLASNPICNSVPSEKSCLFLPGLRREQDKGAPLQELKGGQSEWGGDGGLFYFWVHFLRLVCLLNSYPPGQTRCTITYLRAVGR
jgi:hypothetical protein